MGGSRPEPSCWSTAQGITGADDLCRHGTAWYAHRLGTTLLARLSLDLAGEPSAGADLAGLLAAAIDEVTDLHRDTCRVDDPSSPCATVAIVRRAVIGSTTSCSATA